MLSCDLNLLLTGSSCGKVISISELKGLGIL